MNDGSHYDQVDYRLASGTYQVDMVSTGADPISDPYLIVFRVDGSTLTRVAEDDDSGSGLNARATFTASSGTYRFVFNTLHADDFGTYAYTISRASSRQAQADAGDKPVVTPKAMD